MRLITCLSLILLSISCTRLTQDRSFTSYWEQQPDRYWIGPEFWANRLQDWKIHNGRVECLNGLMPMRTLHVIDHYISDKTGTIKMTVITGRFNDFPPMSESDWTGFLIGAGDLEMNYRARALIHKNHGNGGGIIAAINGKGYPVFIDNETGYIIEPASYSGNPAIITQAQPVRLVLELLPQGNQYILKITASNINTPDNNTSSSIIIDDPNRLSGNIALIANGGANNNGQSFWYTDWKVGGSKIITTTEQQYGPIMGVLYTLSHNTLKLTAQLAPVSAADEQEVTLEMVDTETGKWKEITSTQIWLPGYIAQFRINQWNPGTDAQRLCH